MGCFHMENPTGSPYCSLLDFTCRYFILQLAQQRNVVLKNQMPELYSIKKHALSETGKEYCPQENFPYCFQLLLGGVAPKFLCES